jgi:hypothetical protein
MPRQLDRGTQMHRKLDTGSDAGPGPARCTRPQSASGPSAAARAGRPITTAATGACHGQPAGRARSIT